MSICLLSVAFWEQIFSSFILFILLKKNEWTHSCVALVYSTWAPIHTSTFFSYIKVFSIKYSYSDEHIWEQLGANILPEDTLTWQEQPEIKPTTFRLVDDLLLSWSTATTWNSASPCLPMDRGPKYLTQIILYIQCNEKVFAWFLLHICHTTRHLSRLIMFKTRPLTLTLRSK